jgi:hypothetical protein
MNCMAIDNLWKLLGPLRAAAREVLNGAPGVGSSSWFLWKLLRIYNYLYLIINSRILPPARVPYISA